MGLDTGFFNPSDEAKAAARTDWRQKLKVAEDEVVVLFFGRLSYQSKANPLPMYTALQEAAKKQRQEVVSSLGRLV